MRVFVTDGNNRAALAIVRSLGRAGHEVVVGERRADALAHASRYCVERVCYPDPINASEEFVDALAKVTRERHIDVLIPVADITTFLVVDHRHQFSCAVPCAPAAIVHRAADKADALETAQRIGVPVPRTITIQHGSGIPSMDTLGFPVVIKPWRSRVLSDDGWKLTAVSYAASHEELALDLARRPAYEFPLLLQERIVGQGMGVFACYAGGRPVALFSHRRLRERPPWGGVSVLSESVEVDPVARDYATRLLEAIEWQGVAMVEFKRDNRDGLPKLMEINGRFWGSLQLAIDAGVDFPSILLRSLGGASDIPPVYRTGVRERWFWGDVDALMVRLFGAQGAPTSFEPQIVRALGDFIRVAGRGLHYDNPKWDDPKPFIAETGQWFRNLAGGLAGHAAPNPASRAAAATSAPSPIVRELMTLDSAGLPSAWQRVHDRAATNTVFQTYEWARSWWEVYAGDHQLRLFAVDDEAGCAGLAPLVVQSSSTGDRVMRFLGHGRADYCDFLVPPDRADLLDAICNRIFDDNGWDRLQLQNLPAQSPTVSALREHSHSRGYFVLEDDTECRTLLIHGHEAAARKLVNKPSLRRRQQYFTRSGTLCVRHLDRASEIEPLLEGFFDQHAARWASTDTPSLFLESRNRDFYHALTRNLSPRSWVLFTVVEHDGRPVAFHFGFDHSGVLTWYKPSFDPAVSGWSPGLVLLRQLIQFVIDTRRTELDFTIGDEPFKKHFTNSARRLVRLRIFRHRMRFEMERTRLAAKVVLQRS